MSQQINLYNPIFMKRRNHFSLLTMAQSLGLILVGALCLWIFDFYQLERLNKQSQDNNVRFQAEKARLAQLTAEFSPQQENQQLQNEVHELEMKLADQADLITTLKSDSFGNLKGYSEYMVAFSRQAVHGLWLTGFKVTGDAAHISLSGGVTNPELLPAYIQRLGKESAMRGKNFSSLTMHQVKPESNKAGKEMAAARYVEFTLNSSPESGAGK